MPALPLSERVTAPADIHPAEINGISWRALALDDADDLMTLHAAIAAADHPDWSDSREEILEELGHSYMDLALDSMAAVTESGELVAWGTVIFPTTQDTLVRSILVGGVAPSHRGLGIGRALLAWQHGRGLQQLAGSQKTLPGWLVVSADERSPSSGRIIERAGFVPQRWFQSLSRAVQHPIPGATEAAGFRVIPYSPEYSAGAHSARNRAFRGHGSSQPMSDEQWHSMMSMSTFAHEFSFLALGAHGEVVGLLLALANESGAQSSASSSVYVWVIGVIPDERGRGLATALLTAHLLALRTAGIDRSVMDVATDKAGEGLELYARMGYAAQSTSVNYVRAF